MLDAARAADFPVELLTAVQQVFRRASAAGHGTDDMAAARFAFPR
jgi:3-hydroxyisobutyrate dehydrogenase-like beta-hydroxyacid dehydrogenase